MKLDPRTKLLMIAVLTSLSVLSKDIVYLAVIFATTLFVDIILRVDMSMALKRLRYLISLIVFISLMQSLTVKGGTPLVHIGSINLVTTSGLLSGGEFAIRMSIIILASLIATTAEGREMTDALQKLKIPYEIAFMVSVSLRFLPMFRDEFSARLTALKMRGIIIKKLALNRKIKVYSYLLSATVTGSILKSNELARAMEARAFRAYPRRTMLRDLELKFVDYAVIILSLVFFTAFIVTSIIIGGIL